LDAQIGDTLSVELPDGRVRELVVAGTVHDINLPPARFVNATYGYVDFRTLNDWGYDRQFSQLSITVAQDEMDKAHIEAVAQEVKDKVERSGRQVGSIRVPEPGQPPVQDILDPLLLILGILGVLALLLSGFLVVNTMAAILAQQVRQIGVMKAVGARSGQIMALYFGKALLFGLLSLAIGIPLGAVGAYRLSLFAAQFLNFDVTQRAVYPQVLALQVAVALVMPVAAAAVPTFTGSRITVREAISSYGLGKGRFGQGPFDRLLVSVQRWLPWIGRPLLISLRNTFRRKARLILTMTTLTLGGAIFVAVFSVQLSLFKTLDQAAQYYNYDVYVQFDRAYRIDRIAQDVGQVAGVTAVETWASASAVRERPDGNEGDRIRMLAPMADTTMIRPNLLAGRWLLPEDESALVINSSTLDEEPDLAVGGTVTLKIDGKESDWTVVGVVQSMLLPPTAYANYPYLSRLVGTTGRANFARITIDPDTPADQERTAAVLNDQLDARGYQVSYAATTSQDLESTEFQFNILVTFLLIMALLMAVVGGMGLMGTMSINVMERTREIGVMRAIGASTGAVMQIILVEGMLIGLISWLQGVIVALPIGKLMADQIGYAFVDGPLSYGYSVTGALVWLGIAVLISAVASYLPARTAARLTVREVLSYE
jgi:putative ABC transport system permease protein